MSALLKKFTGRILVSWEQISLPEDRRTDDEARAEMAYKWCGY